MLVKGHLRIGLIGAGPELLGVCVLALRDDGVVTAVDAAGSASDDSDALLLVLADPIEDGIREFARCLGRFPGKPIIPLGRAVDPEVAVELVKDGAADFLSLPFNPEVLVRKIRRALRMTGPRPAFDSAAFAPLRKDSPSPYDGANRRRCFRAEPLVGYRATATVRGARTVIFQVENLSIVTDGQPGGMLLSANATKAPALPLADWERGRAFELQLQLPHGPPIRTVSRMVPGTLRKGGPLRFAVHYSVDKAADAAQVRAFWLECQRAIRD
ncbi:MAG: hypothetical protein EXR72_03980 [Myxococcales bacterium]|nr:hypothetical protein [Myxococcales bacterium]